MISKEHRQKIIGFIQGAVNDGAEILCGGKIPKLDSKLDKGYFLEPTVLGGQHRCNIKSFSRIELAILGFKLIEKNVVHMRLCHITYQSKLIAAHVHV